MRNRTSNRAKSCDISKKVKDAVWERDNHRCVLCGKREAMPNAHYIPRSHGGLGVEQNIVTLCRECHNALDNSTQRTALLGDVKEYLRRKYKEWDETALVYRRS